MKYLQFDIRYHLSSGKHVAIKKIVNAFEVITTAKRTLRELKLLLHFKHDNVVGIKNVIHQHGQADSVASRDVYFVMDLLRTDLHHLIRYVEITFELNLAGFTLKQSVYAKKQVRPFLNKHFTNSAHITSLTSLINSLTHSLNH